MTTTNAPVSPKRAALTLLLLGTLAVHVTMFLNKPSASYRVLALGGDERAVGIVVAASALLPIFLAVSMGRLSDRGRTPALLMSGAVVMGLGSVALANSSSLVTMALFNAVLGIGQLALMVAGQAVVVGLSGPGEHDRNFGWFTAAASLGQLFGPLIGGLVVDGGRVHGMLAATAWAFWAAAGISVLVLISYGALVYVLHGTGALSRSPESSGRPAGRGSALGLLRNRQLSVAIFVSCTVLASVDLLIAYLPVLGERNGLSPAVVGLLLALRAGFSFVSRLGLGVLTRWAGRIRVIFFSAAVGAVAVLGLVLFSDPLVLALIMVVLGLVLGVGQPLTMTWVVEQAPKQLRATALALRITGNRVAQSAAPAAAGALSALVGLGGPFVLMTVLLAGAGAAVVPFLRSAPDEAERTTL